MPRGFLVKRLHQSRHASAPSAGRARTYSDEDPSDSSSDHDGPPPLTLDLPLSLQIQQPPPLLSEKLPLPLPQLYQHVYNHHATSTTNAISDPSSPSSAAHLLLQAYGFRVASINPNTGSPLVPPRTPTTTETPKAPPALTSKKRVGVDAGGGDDLEDDVRRPASKKKCASSSSPSFAKGKPKAVRKLRFDEETSSPVSGTIIRELGVDEEPLVIRRGDVDPSLNVVEVTDEAKAEIAKIENRLGDYICQLCKEVYDDAFGLAQHRCSRIVHVEYRCPECDKLFNCPANLASHRRWHKPRPAAANLSSTPPPETGATNLATSPSAFSSSSSSTSSSLSSSSSADVSECQFECDQCAKRFPKLSHLKKHLDDHHCIDQISLQQQQQHQQHQQKQQKKRFELGNAKGAFQDSLIHSHVTSSAVSMGVGVGAPLECKYCDTKFFSSPGLTRHVNKYHPSENRQVILLHTNSNPGNPIVSN